MFVLVLGFLLCVQPFPSRRCWILVFVEVLLEVKFICWQFIKGNALMDVSAASALDTCTHMLARMWHSVLHSTWSLCIHMRGCG